MSEIEAASANATIALRVANEVDLRLRTIEKRMVNMLDYGEGVSRGEVERMIREALEEPWK